jgi:dephospho-CoA kinase
MNSTIHPASLEPTQSPKSPDSPDFGNALSQLLQTVHLLRAPGGCPWDRAQTHQSLRPYLIEESYEVLDVLDRIEKSEDLKNEALKNNLCEELGDVLMQVLLHSELAQEAGAFDFFDVAKALNAKLIRRHPHVFGEAKADSSEAALKRWEKEKSKEKGSSLDASILDGVPRQLPALQRTARVIEKVTRVGFQWKDLKGPLEKVEEEWAELKVEMQELEKLPKEAPAEILQNVQQRIEAELGDVLFSLSNLAWMLKIHPEDALRSTVQRFERRFKHVERRLKENGKNPEQSSLDEMDRFWNEAKAREKTQIFGLTGGIAAGKSTAAQIFEAAGIPVIDADQITQELSRPGGLAYPMLLERFGTADPQELRKIVFQNSANKKDLEDLLHPLIQEESNRRILQLSLKHRVILYEAALLIETGRFKALAGMIVIDASAETRLQRVLKRKGMTAEIAQKILDAQMPSAALRPYGTWILENNGELADFKTQVQTFIRERHWDEKK